jgi:hypothetical protein
MWTTQGCWSANGEDWHDEGGRIDLDDAERAHTARRFRSLVDECEFAAAAELLREGAGAWCDLTDNEAACLSRELRPRGLSVAFVGAGAICDVPNCWEVLALGWDDDEVTAPDHTTPRELAAQVLGRRVG